MEHRQLIEISVIAVEMGRRYFPHCSDVLDNFLDDVPDDFFLEKGTAEEKRNKKARFMELKEEVQKAVCKDMAENKKSGRLSTSSSSCSPSQRIKKKRTSLVGTSSEFART